MPSNRSPLVTVYIATRNRAHLLPRAVASVFAQGRDDIEIIVVDDCSDDHTLEVLAELEAAHGVRVVRNTSRLGACASRNIALRSARGRYVTGLDDDDEMLPGRVTTLLSQLRSTDSFICASDVILEATNRARLRFVPKVIDLSAILSRNVVGNQILAERAKVLACSGYDESLPAAQDYDLWIRMIHAHGPARGLLRPLQIIHLHRDVRISTSVTRRAGYWAVYRKHRRHMSRQSRRAHLYNLRRVAGHRTRLPADLRFCAAGNRLRLILHALCDGLHSP